MIKSKILLSFCVLIFLGFKTIKSEDLPLQLIKEKLNLSQADLNEIGRKEIKGFVDSKVWQGGYYEGDPTNPNGSSSYHARMNYKGAMVNPLYVCYAECIKPFVNSNIDVLEIGPGHGAWSRAIIGLNPRSLTCVDALSAAHNRFWEFVGNHKNITYFQIKNFLLNELKDDSIDFVFSFGTFCHITPLMCYEYFKNLYKKLRSGAQGFVMYADFDKKCKFASTYYLYQMCDKKHDEIWLYQYEKTADFIGPGWYHLGVERAELMLEELGYEVVNKDVEANERDPIIHFRKP